MNEIAAPYLVQRMSMAGEPWLTVARCESMRYAEMVAEAGLRRHLGVSYRVRNLQTGLELQIGGEECDAPAVETSPRQPTLAGA